MGRKTKFRVHDKPAAVVPTAKDFSERFVKTARSYFLWPEPCFVIIVIMSLSVDKTLETYQNDA